jgi:[glutamine synthetase] adenylyltransferase / [glutamine synthetase]-adenylyl-L-tyrosine phosphorylase
MLTLESLLSLTHATASVGAAVAHLCDCSLWAQRLLAKDTNLLADLLQNHQQVYSTANMQQFLDDAEIVDEMSLKRVLRQLRQRVMLRILYRDLNGLADLAEVMQTTTNLAEICIQKAVHINEAWLKTSIHAASRPSKNAPHNLESQKNGFIVVGMGKLGGAELNVSSDVDLIFAYDENADFPAELSAQDFYNQLGKKVIAALDENTEDGFVFRVDMRLRPFGSEGVLVPNLDALADYYQNNGREWERYAWIKGRVIVASTALKSSIHALLRPFVFRKYLDFGAINSMRDLKVQIARDVAQKGMEDNIKLGRGGIREIEFIAQVFQLIRGGRDESLQIKPTLKVLKLIQNKGFLDKLTVDYLMQAYTFLRNLEHRLMYVDDAQTHELPKTDEAKMRIAKAMHFADWPSLLAQLNTHRKVVQTQFDATFSDKFSTENAAQNQTLIALWQNTLIDDDALRAIFHAGYSDAKIARQRLQGFLNSQKYKNLPESSRQRLDALMPLVIAEAGQQTNADDALLRMIHLLENICRRASYLALLTEFPDALRLVVKLCAASPWLAQYLAAHPILLDELLDTQNLYAEPDFTQLKQSFTKKMAELVNDAEAQMDAMRHFKHAAIMRFAAQDIAQKVSLETLSDYLSALADTILQVAIDTIWASFKYQHQPKPNFAVIGYGKLGSKELGYVSDLDIIFLYKDAHENAADIYARFAQRISSWFNTLTNAGLLYETDLQLRPDGNSGLLVSSVAAFEDYQQHKAWVWEHQALTRARFVAGDASIGAAFEQIRINVLTTTREEQKLKTEVIAMREKMRAANVPKTDLFDIKHSAGGIIDVEFLVQFLVLNYANKHKQLTDNKCNIALLNQLSLLKVIDQTLAAKVIIAYREFRRLQHALKLQGTTQIQVKSELVAEHAAAVKSLWHAVLMQ